MLRVNFLHNTLTRNLETFLVAIYRRATLKSTFRIESLGAQHCNMYTWQKEALRF